MRNRVCDKQDKQKYVFGMIYGVKESGDTKLERVLFTINNLFQSA